MGVGAADQPVVEGVHIRRGQRNVLRRPLEGRNLPRQREHGVRDELGVGEGGLDGVPQIAHLIFRWQLAEPAGTQLHGMGAAAADDFHDGVAEFVQADDGEHDFGVTIHQRDHGLDAREVRRDQVADVEEMALDLLAVHAQQSQLLRLLRDRDVHRGFDRVQRGEGVGHGADAADAAGDGLHLIPPATAHHRLEEARRLGHLPFHTLDLAVLRGEADVRVPLDAGHVVDVDIYVGLGALGGGGLRGFRHRPSPVSH